MQARKYVSSYFSRKCIEAKRVVLKWGLTGILHIAMTEQPAPGTYSISKTEMAEPEQGFTCTEKFRASAEDYPDSAKGLHQDTLFQIILNI